MPQYAQSHKSCTVKVLQKYDNTPNKIPKKKLPHTWDHRDCPACEASETVVTSFDLDLSAVYFLEAAELWKSWRLPTWKKGTEVSYSEYIWALERFFGALTLSEIRPGHLREYQLARSVNLDGRWKRPAAYSRINHELNTLAQIMDHGNLWERIKRYYQPLRQPPWVPKRVMSEEEEKLFIRKREELKDTIGYHLATVSDNTGATGCELLGMRLEHVLLVQPIPELLVPSDSVKNEYRARRVPLNGPALKSVQWFYRRASSYGACRPEHYLFPFRVRRGRWDVSRPATYAWIRAAFGRLRKDLGMEWLRPHDMRHQCVTRMLEAGINESTVMSVVGHVSLSMLKRYSHIRQESKYEALKAIAR